MRASPFAKAVAAALGALLWPSGAGAQPFPDGDAALIEDPWPLGAGVQGELAPWFFAFKLNAATAPSTGEVADCRFGGTPKSYHAGQHYLIAKPGSTLVDGTGLIGTSLTDPLGAIFEQIYRGPHSFVVWNDQFYRHPNIAGCGESCASPWGHSKGVLAWDGKGRGIVIQVTTPSWPGSGTSAVPRARDGNTLGCVEDNDVKASQHFFALRLSPADTAAVLEGLVNASVVTDLANPQLARIAGPDEIKSLAVQLGHKSQSTQLIDRTLTSGVRLLSKPSRLHVPPWQMVSAKLGGIPLRTATWWAVPRIPTTEAGRTIICWRDDLGQPGRVEVAITGAWHATSIGLKGGPHENANHAKIGVSLDDGHHLAIFGDLNQQGRLTNRCDSSQNGRGGLFFVVDDVQLHAGISALIAGETAALTVPGSEVAARPSRRARRQHR